VSLRLDFNQIGAQSAKDLKKVLKVSNIRRLGLDCNNVGAQGAKDLVEALKDTNVISIALNFSNISEQLLKEIDEVIEANKDRLFLSPYILMSLPKLPEAEKQKYSGLKAGKLRILAHLDQGRWFYWIRYCGFNGSKILAQLDRLIAETRNGDPLPEFLIHYQKS
jgi:hypothetical protein